MILVSVGTQLPFDRLVRTVDEWAIEQGRTDIVAQIGPGRYKPRQLKSLEFVEARQFRQYQMDAQVHVAHAGMGSILTALEFGKPIIILPREHARGEHRNDHQLATAKRFQNTPGVLVCWNEHDLRQALDSIETLNGAGAGSGKAPAEFVGRLREFLESPEKPRDLWRRLLYPAGD